MRLVWILILLGVLLAVLYLFSSLGDVFDSLSANWSHIDYSGVNATTISPTSEALANSWKYLVGFVVIGGILWIIFRTFRGEKSGD